MKVKINIDKSLEKGLAIISTNSDTLIVRELQKAIQDLQFDSLYCYDGYELVRISYADIFSIYCDGPLVKVVTTSGEYEIKKRIYALELEDVGFIRINSGVIVNFNKIERFDYSFSGKLTVQLLNKYKYSVSRRNIKKVKKMLEGDLT